MMEDVGGSRTHSSSNSVWATIKKFDIYTKVDENYRVRTSWGALLSIVGWILIAILVLSETKAYLTPNIKDHMVVDTTLGQQLVININITFHALTCAEVHIDAMDVAGDNQLNIEHDMLKQRLSPLGFPLGDPSVEIIGEIEGSASLPADYCGPCYGAESETTKCCNTCDELKLAYEARGWSTGDILKKSDQCLRDKSNPFANVHPGEGCRVTGSMRVNKVAGNFHMTLGDSIVRDGAHIHQFVPSEAPGFNVSHTIHGISFGEPYPSMPPNPLDGVVRIVNNDTGTGLFQYFIKVVPTQYTAGQAAGLLTNQYTVTEKFRPVAMTDYHKRAAFTATVIPGIFFVYELSPFMVEVSRSTVPLSHFLSRVLAIVGGVFCLLGVFDAFLYRFLKLTSKSA